MNRLKAVSGLIQWTALLGWAVGGIAQAADEYISRRPPLEKRTFVSEAVEETIRRVKPQIRDPKLAWMFENCFPNTLDTTVDFEIIDGKPDTFIITGDIDAMWLRDSTCQVWPYMPLIQKDAKLRQLIAGLVRRQTKCVLLDPYANAFYKDMNRPSHWASDRPSPGPGVHERKWEVDSLCYVIRLAYEYWRQTGDVSCFDADWDRAMRLIVSTFKTEQRKDGQSPYRFIRVTSRMTDAPVFDGTGQPMRPVGMIASMFRPSDDATVLPFLVPSNLFAVQSLRQLAEMYEKGQMDRAFARECRQLADEVEKAVLKWGTAKHLQFGTIYAYEADGFGNVLFMDDSNVPSLLSLPYLGICRPKDPLYRRTRQFLLSEWNPWYLKGKAAEGAGSPHTGKTHIWPMGIILRALTSQDPQEIRMCLHLLKTTDGDTGFMHEAFHKDNPNDFTRHWFAWANTLFGELILKVYHEHPDLLKLEEI
ncbi:MAG TPA: glycoside hydrolase family 125 protein [Anaerohalosphaeraceae bacterium]|nr:glycoside hydrolase family 125 protein [Anaerohalosphaeraceae bacterium]HOL89000.1 glycoside hydrolase family 125 protein [Anaerohalosphaeraceae bacterium]HPP56451.1 glycoside hydrolase family 125 protein [Anaerohalosphaeraceae bacterium]